MTSWSGRGAATQIYSPDFDHDFAGLPASTQRRIEEKLEDMGRRLGSFSHYRMTGSQDCRLRIGDYRVIYQFDVARNEILVLGVGHRGEIYRK